MNPFDRIREYRAALLLQIKDTLVQPSDTLTYKEHYKTLLTFLKLLEEDLKNSEYEYVLKQYGGNNETGYCQYDGMTIQSGMLSDNLLLFQPLFVDHTYSYSPDMESLIDALTALKEAGRFKEDVIVIPPGINIIRAKLAGSEDQEEEDSDSFSYTDKELERQKNLTDALREYEETMREKESEIREITSTFSDEYTAPISDYGIFTDEDEEESDMRKYYPTTDDSDYLPF